MVPLEIQQAFIHPSENMLLYSAPMHDAAMALPTSPRNSHVRTRHWRSLEDLSGEVSHLFPKSTKISHMVIMSKQMRLQYRRQLKESPNCMLPSYCHSLPTGHERGTYLALDVGGSTLRLGLVDLNGRHQKDALRIRRMTVAVIDRAVRRLPSAQFFDWIAQRVERMLTEEQETELANQRVWPLGISWSFPLDQTSPRSGKVRSMGKGFNCHNDTVGKDLGELTESACRARGVAVRVDAIVNDASATLLSQAYLDASTSVGLIVGTGTNAAVQLPTSCIAADKFGERDPSWFARADKVITNTELSMFGEGILPMTRWDEALNSAHALPDFQPLEYKTTGRYLSEILRLVILEAIDTCGLFSGNVPPRLQESYSLETTLLARLESDNTIDLTKSAVFLQELLQLDTLPSQPEMTFLRQVTEAISQRATAYLAIAIHALWALQKETEINPTTPSGTPKTSIACNGSVILKYPRFRERCEEMVGEMIRAGTGAHGLFTVEQVVLQPTEEAAVLGAAVAVALSADE